MKTFESWWEGLNMRIRPRTRIDALEDRIKHTKDEKVIQATKETIENVATVENEHLRVMLEKALKERKTCTQEQFKNAVQDVINAARAVGELIGAARSTPSAHTLANASLLEATIRLQMLAFEDTLVDIDAARERLNMLKTDRERIKRNWGRDE